MKDLLFGIGMLMAIIACFTLPISVIMAIYDFAQGMELAQALWSGAKTFMLCILGGIIGWFLIIVGSTK